MKLYVYSKEQFTFVEAKWIRSKLAVVAVVVGCTIFFGLIKLDQAAAITSGSQSARLLESENNILRQELILISPRVNELELRTKRLSARASTLSRRLQSSMITGDTVSYLTYATKGFGLQSTR